MSVVSLKKILRKLRNKEYRDAYAVEHVQTSLPFQIRALRERREWTQARLASEAGTTQTAISRIEDPDYGKLSLNTLYKLASAFDVALLVKFVPFSRLLDEFKDVSVETLAAESFTDELPKLEERAVKPLSTTVEVDAPPAWAFAGGRTSTTNVFSPVTLSPVILSSNFRFPAEPILPDVVWLATQQYLDPFSETEAQPFLKKTAGTSISPLLDVGELNTYTM
jgi:transcriptional regulator with XRE-family HTH domain